ncbi:hypothetical protein [Streptomyces sp. NPDC090132]|uniref:hypothetical protein n=1 Tax=Streptomyces sp. NPDC090132 TaxID=3365955 RepID=UPI00382E0844
MNDTVYGRLRKFAAELTVPPGLEYPEISHGEIVMVMSPVKRHELAALRLRRQLDAQLTDGVVAHTGGDVEEQALGILRRPDVIRWARPSRSSPSPRGSRNRREHHPRCRREDQHYRDGEPPAPKT